jgi:hypothetical protein
MALRRFLFACAAVIAAGGAAIAAPEAPASASQPQWSLGLLGGALAPVGAMRTDHRRGLDAGVRVAWTSRLGLGIETAVDYSPLPHATVDGATFDTVYGVAAIGPRYAAGWSILRLGLAAVGGAAMDRTSRTDVLGRTTTTEIAPAAQVGVELELRVVSGGGVLLTGGGTQTFGKLDYRYAYAMGGLALAF